MPRLQGLALMRLRGLECRADSGFAEEFHCRKLVFSPVAPDTRSATEEHAPAVAKSALDGRE